ncbi:hypothetical protein F5884DRAFT_745545 [Xylogone sp. PMI_703]|nr:hypothetical protein F5884DRAFT_745545 [Xylogone sp. PMI_703]
MEIPQRTSMGLPEIYVQDSHSADRFRSSSSSYHSSGAIPMSIPNARDPVPPPLPPPRHIADIAEGGHNGEDLAWKWGNPDSAWGSAASTASIAPGSSLHGSFTSKRPGSRDNHQDDSRRSSASTIRSLSSQDTRDYSYPRIDEGYSSLSGTSFGSNKVSRLLGHNGYAKLLISFADPLFASRYTCISVWGVSAINYWLTILLSNRSRYHESSPPRSGFQSSVHDRFQSSNAQAYDKSLLNRLNSRGPANNSTPPRTFSIPSLSSSASEASPPPHRYPPQLKPLSLPINTRPTAPWGDTPLSSAISPGSSYPNYGINGQYDYRSPSDTAESDRSPHPYSRRDPYDSHPSPENETDFQMEETGIRRLHLDDYSARPDAYSPGSTTGQKRRALEDPPRDDSAALHAVGSAGDLFRRRESSSRVSPGPPHYHSSSASVSSTASGRTGSYSSTRSLPNGSITSMSSFGRVSPSMASADLGSDSQYMGAASRMAAHHRALSETRPIMTSRKHSDSVGHVKHSSAPKMHGVFICECCPKKPKKFDSQAELSSHEQEKQYECAYCRNRFKNKNEAERHQNSLHLRRHSWSCAALTGFEAAFHPSSARPNEADTCGYCGEDFPRSGISSPMSSADAPSAVATERDWEVRIQHLQEMHKFGECNHAKKFFRADHFRQHLKHSHAGTSGKWTNMLENACMKDEPLPEPIRGPERVSPVGSRVGRINEEEEMEMS